MTMQMKGPIFYSRLSVVNALSIVKANQNHAVIHFALLSTENRLDVRHQSS